MRQRAQQGEAERHDDDHGAAAVEFALLLIPLLILVGGLIDFGFAFNAQITLTHAAREGVRVEAIGTGDAVASALGAANAVAIDPNTIQAAIDRPCPHDDGAQVSVQAPYPFIFVGIIPGLPNEITLRAEAVMRCGG